MHNPAKMNDTPKWLEKLARVGFATKGTLYAIIGVLALMTAIGEGGQTGGSSDAIQKIAQQPFGKALLVLTAIGLFAYALWRFVQSAMDPENEGTDGKGVAKRIGYGVSGLMHAFLGVNVVQMLMGSGGSGGGSKQTYVAKIMAIDTVGPILIGLLGAIVVGVGIYQITKAWKVKFAEKLKTGEMSRKVQEVAIKAGRAGLTARGIVFGIIGGFLVKAAITHNPGQTKGVGEALAEIGSQSYGAILLGLVAAGLVAYAVHQFVFARYRKIPA
ncbi:MAG: hypothetical protein CMN30_15505 [Sandaracinus sp.]|nr:hypothetical protein [Sandaracinus sp.]|tara:strand:+ start:2545 stop:3360 length:816 start_codon:yes stop_codon:yes gene_type:complete